MSTKYNIEEWAAGTNRGRRVFNYGYSLSGSEFKGWNLLKVVTLQEGRGVTEKAYIWQSRSNPKHQMIRVDISEHYQWQLAQERLYKHLTECARPDIPRGTKELSQLGDVVFVGKKPQTDIAGAISFTRGNVLVLVRSVGEKTVDVSNIATRIDRALSQPPVKREEEKGKVRTQMPRVATVKANESYALIKNLRETTPSGGWLKVIVTDGELSRKGDALIYLSHRSGKKKVGTYVANFDWIVGTQ